MGKEFRFYLDGVELTSDLYNFGDIDFVLVRNDKFWGYYRGASLSSLEFIKQDAKKVESIWENGNINTSIPFRIDTINRIFNTYETFQSGVLNFNEYGEKLTVNGTEVISVGFTNNESQEKIKGRGKNNIVIGENKSIEGVNLTGNQLVKTTYKRSKQRFFTGWRWSVYLQKTPDDLANVQVPYANILNPNSNLGDNDMSFGLEMMNSNDPSAKSQSAYSYLGSFEPGLAGMMFSEDVVDRQVTIKGSISLKLALMKPLVTVQEDYHLIFSLDEYQFDAPNNKYIKISNIIGTFFEVSLLPSDIPANSTYPFNGGLNVFPFNDVDTHTTEREIPVTINTTFTKKKNRVYGFNWELVQLPLLVQPVATIFAYVDIIENGENTLTTYYDDNLDEFPDTSHKSIMVYEALDSALQQITDKPAILKSSIFGKVANGYHSDGLGSLIAITSGLLLRNAVNPDGTSINLSLNFFDLYETLDSIFGLAMWWDGDFINIEKREDAFGNIETELTYSEITSEVMTELIYTGVKVGNKRIPYEDVNGTNEHNTILEFSTPLRTEENVLNLVTVYNTDYTGIERARRLSFINADNVDTKYDEKIFLSVVERFGTEFKTVLGFNGYDTITGITLPGEAGNLDLSPKRMLLNNIDLIGTSFWKVNKDLLYKTSENLSTLQSRKTAGNLIIEQLDVDKSEMTPVQVVPFKHTLTVGKKDIVRALNNPLNYYYFYKNNKKVVCELWSATVKNNKGTIELIQKS